MVVIGLSILATTMWTARSEAHCYSIWHYKTPQRCGSIRYLPKPTFEAKRAEQIAPRAEQIEIPIPSLDFNVCPDGDERMQGIAKLRAMSDGP